MSLKKIIYNFFDDSPSRALIAALLGSSLLALSPLFVRFSEVGSTATAFYRFFFALPVIWTWMIFDNIKPEKHRTPRTVREYLMLLLAGICLGIDISLWHLAMITTSIVNAVILNALTPVVVAFGAWIFFKEKITPPLALGIGLALAGSYVLVSASSQNQASTLTGDIYAMGSAIFYGCFMICMKDLRKSFSTPTIMFWVALVGMYVLAINSHFMNEVVVPKTPGGWMHLFTLAMVVHILGGGLLAYSVGHLSATFSSLTILVGPVVAGLIGWIVFGEALVMQQGIGALIIILGIVISRLTRLTLKRKTHHNISH